MYRAFCTSLKHRYFFEAELIAEYKSPKNITSPIFVHEILFEKPVEPEAVFYIQNIPEDPLDSKTWHIAHIDFVGFPCRQHWVSFIFNKAIPSNGEGWF